MKDLLKKLMLMLSFVAVVGLTACDDDDDDCEPCNCNPCGSDAELRGDIATDMRLDSTKTYKIVGFVNIQPGATLTIPAGTKLICSRGDRGTIQTIPGTENVPTGKLIAEGTKDKPIVITSAEKVGQRARGDVGGIVLNGVAPNNEPDGIVGGEGGAADGGGDKADDNSGSLKYVRVEFGGTTVSEGNEVNGFTFNSVGDATSLDYLQAHFIDDDAFEWFGGTVNAKHLLATGVRDDSFDQDRGWTGKYQFAVSVQGKTKGLGRRGFENNNNADGTDDKPFTNPTGYNITLVGHGDKNAAKEKDGIYLRGNVRGIYKNIIVANFADHGLVFEMNETLQGYMNDESAVTNAMFWVMGNVKNGGTTNGSTDWFDVKSKGTAISSADSAAAFAKLQNNKCFVANPSWGYNYPDNPFQGTMPDLKPSANAVSDSAATPPNDGFFDVSATYLGAINPNGDNWLSDWTFWEGE